MSNIDCYSHQWVWEKPNSQGNPLLANKMPLKNFEDVLIFYYQPKIYDTELKHPLREYTIKLREYTKYSRTKFRQLLGHNKFQHFMELQQQFSLCTEDTYNELIEKFNIDKMNGFIEFNQLVSLNLEFKKTLIKFSRTYNPQKTLGRSYRTKQGYLGEAFGGSEKEIQTINSGDRLPKSIIKFNRQVGLHPTQKPVALIEYLIKTYTNEGMLILDNCSGSGTLGIGCINTGRKYIMIEKEKKYFDMSVERIKNHLEKIGK